MTIATLVAALSLSLGAGVPPPIVIPQGAPSQAAPQRIENIASLVGEWEGELRITTDKGTSVSLVGLSVEREASTSDLLLGFQGLAYANIMEGAARLGLDHTGSITGAWYDTLANTPITFTEGTTTQPSTNSITLDSISLDQNQVLRQILTLQSQQHATLEIVSLTPGEQPATVLSMDLYRLPQGQLSMGTGLTRSPALIARLNAANQNTATANVNPNAE